MSTSLNSARTGTLVDCLSSSSARLLSDAKDQANAIAASATEKASDIASDAKATTSRMISDLGENLKETAEKQKNVGADAIASLARSTD
jgi:cell division septum initiation protein DivIVA